MSQMRLKQIDDERLSADYPKCIADKLRPVNADLPFVLDLFARALAWPLSQLIILAESVETKDRKPLDQPMGDMSPTSSGRQQ